MGGFLLEFNMATVSKLQIVLEATTTAFDRGLRSAQRSLTDFGRRTQDLHNRMDRFAKRNADALEGLQTAGQAAAVGLGAMAYGIKGAVDEAVKFEQAMAEVKKVMDFDTPKAFKQMQDDIIGMSQRLPMAADQIAQIMAAAGQAGIAQNELSQFTESAVKMGVAFDITAEQAGQAMAEMRVAFKMSQTEVETLADKINYLGNTTPNSADKILEVVQRIGSLGGVAGVSSDQIAALAGSITAVKPEVAATGIKNMMIYMTKGANATKAQKEAFDSLGLSAEQVAKNMQIDSMGTFLDVIERIKKLPKDLQVATINEIFGTEALPIIAQYVDSTDTLKKNLQAMGDASLYAGSMLAEFEGMAGTTQAQMQTFGNNVTAVKIALGSAFLPTINSVMQSLTPFLQSMADFASNNPELVTTITAIIAGALGLVTVLGGLALAFTAVTSGLGSIIAIGTMISGFVASISSAVSFVGAFGSALAMLGFPVTVVVAGITALIAVGVLLYRNWDTVKAKATELWQALPQMANDAWLAVQSAWNGVEAWFGGVWDSIKQSFMAWLGGMPQPVQDMVANIGTIFSTLVSVAQMVWDSIVATAKWVSDGIVSAWQGLVGMVSTIWGEIKSVVTAVIDSLAPIAKAGFEIFSSVAKVQFTAVKTVVSVVFEAIKAFLSAWVNSAKAIFTAGITVFASVFNAGFALIKNAFTTAFNVIRALVRGDMQGVANAIRTGLSNAVSIIRTMITNIVGVFKNLGSQLLQAGRDAIQGFINGVRQKVSEALNVARDMANSVASTVKSALNIRSPSRVMRELGAWAGEGFVLGVGDKIKDVKQVAQELANALTNTVQDLHRQHFMLTNHANPLADLEYKLQFGELAELTDKQKNRLRELAQINLDIQKANEATAESLRRQEQSAQTIATANERSKSNYDSLQKQIALFGNQSKLAEFDYEWASGKYADVDNMLLLRERSAIAELEQRERQDRAKNAFSQMQSSMAGELSPLAKLQKELDERLQIIKDFENAHTGVELEAQLARQQAEQAYLTAKNNLMLTTYEQGLGAVNGIIKSAFGEQSGIYRAMFAMEKGMALARVLLQNKVALANAWSSAPFPQNLPIVAKTAIETGVLSGAISAIEPIIGQAHDGIMSVPKSGTWNLEKGERVLPKHTAQNLDNTLSRLQGRGETNVIINNYTSEKAEVQKNENGDIMVVIGKVIDAKINQRFMNARRQGGELYRR